MWILKSSCSQSVGRNWSSQFGTLVSCGNGPFFHFSMLPTWNIDPICLHVKNPESLTTLSKGFQLSLVFFPLLFCTFATTSPCVLGILSCKRRIHQIRNQNQENFFVELSSPRTGSLHLIWLLYWRSVSFILNLECYYLYFWYKSLLFPFFPC